MYYGKGLDFVATATFKAKSKNAGIRDRTQDFAVRNVETNFPIEIYYISMGKSVSGPETNFPI